MPRIGHINNFDAFSIADKRVSKLNLNGPRTFEERRTNFGYNLRLERIIDVDYHESAVAGDVRVSSRNRYAVSSVEHTVRVPGQCTLQKVVLGVAVQQSRG